MKEAPTLISYIYMYIYVYMCVRFLVLAVHAVFSAGVGVLGGQLFAAGGHDGPLVRKSVEVYDAQTNTWRLVCDMNMCRRNAGQTDDLGFTEGPHAHPCASPQRRLCH